MPEVLVIGSSNTDLVISTNRLPKPGETLLGAAFFTAPGGKGANQAVAAARSGAHVTLIARVGQDDFGKTAMAGFQKEGIDTTYVLADPELPSGVAFILVDGQGENSIVVASGANAALSPVQIDAAAPAFERADLCLLQLETPLDTVEYATLLAVEHHVPVILNPAPACPLSANLLSNLDIITPNETETEILTGILPDTEDKAYQAARSLLEQGVKTILITLGSRGAFLVADGKPTHIPAPSATVKDTTAAGDAFNGALASALSAGQSLEDAVKFANGAGALTVTKQGAQPAIPTKQDIDNILINSIL
ncbi:MAG: ribokinase [bacterium]|nr:ribokinase [bacterium]